MSKLYFRYGVMGCGKTTLLLQVIYNYYEKGMKTILIKPSIDTKASDSVSSRIGLEKKVDVLLKAHDRIMDINFNEVKAIVVDEAQFLTPAQVDELYYVTKFLEIPVICYGIRCDFSMNTFPGSARLLAIADQLEEIKTICKCGVKATQNVRYKDGVPVFSGNQVEIDDGKTYTYGNLCGKCYLKLKKEGEKDGRKANKRR